MSFIDFTSPRIGKITYSYQSFADAKTFFFDKWCEMATFRSLIEPIDLSTSCKYGSLFTQNVFGGSIRGHYEHQYNFIEGRLVDLSHDSLDVGRMNNPYLHELTYFDIPEVQTSLVQCISRANQWADEFVAIQNVNSVQPTIFKS